MRGTSVIAICQMPTMRREITVRNVVFGELRLARRTRPTTARRDASPHRAAATSAASPAVGRASMTGGFLSHGEGNYEPVQGDF